MSAVNNLKGANFDDAEITLWVFKKPSIQDGNVRFSGSWVETSEGVDLALKGVLVSQTAKIEEVEPYGLLAQNNEGSALSISAVETHVGLDDAAYG